MHSVNETETSSSLDDFIFDPDEMTGIENEETDGVNTQTGDVHPWDTSMVDVNTGDLSMEEEEARKNMKRKLSELYSLDDSFEEHYDSVYIVDGSNQIV
ncbi:hypothetical protein CHS0354_006330 [Potamilus streckersoni]|nr:hypothetical protein CHS0354_006330 [Potamilus streckersoni]